MNDAVFSPCGTFRYRLDRDCAPSGPIYAYFGVNGATAGKINNDHTVRKWIGFTTRFGGSRFIVGNPYAFCATDVRQLASAVDPIGPDNDRYLAEIIAEADILVPCWGSRAKLPRRLRPRLYDLADKLIASRKPILCFGLTDAGDPLHPLTLSYQTKLIPYPCGVFA